MIVLGIESSCDETAAAVVRDGNVMLSSVIASQIEMHMPFGGVVPELASREHLLKIDPIVERAVADARIDLAKIDAIAVTQGPGLIGSLLVGVCYAKSLAFSLGKPLVGVNHIEGHFYSVVFEGRKINFPAVALIVSGGHTNLFYAPEEGKYRLISRTRDDAAGEAFDKVAKMLGLGYPGGPMIERIAKDGDSRKVRFPVAKISDGKPDFSFSGLKTAVARYIRENRLEYRGGAAEVPQWVKDVAAGVQDSIVRSLVGTLERSAIELSPRTLIVAGGVASNGQLRERAAAAAKRLGLPILFPTKHLSTDNAAMIAAAGTARLRAGRVDHFDITADITVRLQNLPGQSDNIDTKRVRYRV